ncbi:MAG: TPM domain-containing protein [Verrucomicrobia bacterium]|nr:TPM domain-containing protein [Verrucomicrobiota bacterium]MBV9671578.1 TPM domain-containing protein [Verrucomicrobiota bacterium]
MKALKKSIFVLYGLAFCSSFAVQTLALPPEPPRYLNDFVPVLKPGAANRLNTQLKAFDHETAIELVVVIYPSLPAGVTSQQYAKQLFNSWNLGHPPRGMGALLLVISNKDPQTYIYAGKGLANKLSPAVCAKIFTEKIAPRFNVNDYEGGLTAAINALISVSRS